MFFFYTLVVRSQVREENNRKYFEVGRIVERVCPSHCVLIVHFVTIRRVVRKENNECNDRRIGSRLKVHRNVLVSISYSLSLDFVIPTNDANSADGT